MAYREEFGPALLVRLCGSARLRRARMKVGFYIGGVSPTAGGGYTFVESALSAHVLRQL
jgi:hypothetical protein